MKAVFEADDTAPRCLPAAEVSLNGVFVADLHIDFIVFDEPLPLPKRGRTPRHEGLAALAPLVRPVPRANVGEGSTRAWHPPPAAEDAPACLPSSVRQRDRRRGRDPASGGG